jgi:polysaccharide pyruvyl transferase WcaK-like protein
MKRRRFLAATASAIIAASSRALARENRPPRILLRNAWQSQNIGDIAHYLGLLELLERFEMDVEIRLWPGNLDNGADALLAKRFPKVVVVKGTEAIAAAFDECDFFLHGSSSGFAASKDAARWHNETRKPFGVLGISLTSTDPGQIALLSKADFVFFRDGVSLQRAKELGCTAPIMAFGPDTAFGVVSLRNDEAATTFLRAHGLEEGKFMCCIPRYRWTPFWTIHPERPVDATKLARNTEMKEHDHAPLRAAIEAITRETEMKVLVTCEDQTQIALGKEMLVDPLPADLRKKVVWRDRYWLPDEALSTYVRSAGLFGNEMHSPILCISSGVPAVVCRFEEQTNKGFMWRDLGLDDWLFTLDNAADITRIPGTVLDIAKNPAQARTKAARARAIVQQRQREEIAVLTASLQKSRSAR